MARIVFRKIYLLLLPFMLVFTSCVPPPAFMQAVRLFGESALKHTVILAGKELIDRGYEFFFGTAAKASADPLQHLVEVIPGKPGYGRLKESQQYIIQGTSRSGQALDANFITIDKKHFEFHRSQMGNWEMTLYTADYIKNRMIVASCQQSLIAMGYKPGRIDGFFGIKTSNAVLKFKQNNSNYYTRNEINKNLDTKTRSLLLEY